MLPSEDLLHRTYVFTKSGLSVNCSIWRIDEVLAYATFTDETALYLPGAFESGLPPALCKILQDLDRARATWSLEKVERDPWLDVVRADLELDLARAQAEMNRRFLFGTFERHAAELAGETATKAVAKRRFYLALVVVPPAIGSCTAILSPH
ncbi:hypothetical protein ACFPL7_23650 [Dongia soli]|uniref:Uncharacterized protein n=1 Tax=Dongia soli TaxID=600628 RepID=A0ABU5EFW2_9PROT|nr:hypothetical protein [Dongia soli]MDY0885298.1 hypothetical protein [Dongia soli]